MCHGKQENRRGNTRIVNGREGMKKYLEILQDLIGLGYIRFVWGGERLFGLSQSLAYLSRT